MPAKMAWMPKRFYCALMALWVGSIAAVSWAADEFPYQAYVLSENVEVVAGPGHRFYATDRLSRGTLVEIYREEPSGWLAIRPPEGAFSWIPAEFVERLEDDQLGRVKEPTGAWIGTSVEHVSEHQQQVTLKAGELVQVLGEKAVAKESDKRKWLKISPPAGEYRWVHLRDVSRQKPEEPMPKVAAKDETQEKPAELAAASDPKAESEEPRRIELAGISAALRDLDERRGRLDRQVEPAQFRSSAAGQGVSLSPDGFVPRRRRGEEAAAPVGSAPAFTSVASSPVRPRLDPDSRMVTASRVRPIPSPTSTSSPIRGGLSGDQIARELDQIELDLSLMIAQDRSQWNLAALARRVETLIEGGADPAARGKARLVLDKIKLFEDAFASRSIGQQSTAGQAGNGTKAAEKSNPLSDPRYDAQGWLKPVVSKKSKTPAAPYAVVDAEGQPLCFVSPSPGLNLNRYLNKQVGLYGRRGYMEELKKPHVVAERVIELGGQLR